MREISDEVGEEDRDPDQLLDHHEDERRSGSSPRTGWSGRRAAGRRGRPRTAARTRSCPTQAPPPMSCCLPSSSGGICALAEMPSARKPILSDSASATTPRTTGSRSSRWRFVQETSGSEITSISPFAPSFESRPPVGELLGRRLADRHGPRGDAAHHHALEHGLAADGRVLVASRSFGVAPFVEVGHSPHSSYRRLAERLYLLSALSAGRARARCRPRRSRRSPSRGPPRRARAGCTRARGSRRCAARRREPTRATRCPPRRRPR